MNKSIGKLFIYAILSFILISCASSSKGSGGMAPAYDSEVSDASRPGSSEVARSATAGNEADNRMVTYSATLELSVKSTEETRGVLIEQVKENKGFIVREADNYITARIPSENMEHYLSAAKALGEIENESKIGTDITDQYRDNVIRLESLKSVRDRYLALLEKAVNVNEILSIEKELERVNTAIELLEGRIKQAELSVAYSSVTVRFREKAKPGPVGWVFYGLFRGIKWLFVWD